MEKKLPEPLSPKRISALKPIVVNKKTGQKKSNTIFDTRYAPGGVAGLLVRCQPNGNKSFYYQFRRPAFVKNRKTGESTLKKHATTRVCLGRTDDITIKQARDKARLVRDTVRAARRAELTGNNVIELVHQALLGLDTPAKKLEARQEKERQCPTVEQFIDGEYVRFKRIDQGLKTFQDDRETQRLKYVLSVLAHAPKKGDAKRINGDPKLNLLTKKLDEIDSRLIRQWKVARLLRPSDRTGRPPSRVTVQRELMMMRAMFDAAYMLRHIDSNPLVEERRKKIKKKTFKSKKREGLLTTAQENRLMKALAVREDRLRSRRQAANEFAEKEGGRTRPELPDDKYVDFLQPMILIAINTGLRFGEIASLSWENVHLTNSTGDENRNYLTILDPKNGEELDMPLNSDAMRVLRLWQVWPGKNVPSIDKKSLVFTDRKGKKLVDIRRFWLPVFQKAGLPKGYRFHDLRHHFASKLVSMGKPLFAVQALLNHSNPKMTERYAKHAPEYLASVVESLAKDSE